MSRSLRLSVLTVIVCGGLLAWLSQASPVPAQVPSVNPVADVATEATTAQAANTIPAPPAHRAEGIFDFRVGSKAEETIQKALVDPQGVNIEFVDTPLKDAMDFIADANDITVLIDETALTEEGIAIDEPINRTLSGVKLQSALNIILKPLGLTYVIEDEVLKITTILAADQKLFLRVYNTGYLKQVGVDPEALSKTIQAVVEPAEWRGNDRPVQQSDEGDSQSKAKAEEKQNSIQALGDMLVVSAPSSVHDKIQALLVQIDHRWQLEHGKK